MLAASLAVWASPAVSGDYEVDSYPTPSKVTWTSLRLSTFLLWK